MDKVFEGGCYCGAVRYRAEGEPLLKAECFCRECQYITGGSAALVMAVPTAGFAITKGQTKAFARPDLTNPVSREFCENCGTHLLTRAPGFPAGVILKVGSLDEPGLFEGGSFAAFACDKQVFHRLPTDMPVHDKWPG
jgi:hypothetical protein